MAGEANICIACGTAQTPKRDGAHYMLTSDRGETLRAWICDSCAIDLGPPQGPIVVKPGMSGVKA